MGYVIDTNSFITMGHLAPRAFPSYWNDFNWLVNAGKIISVREVYVELDNHNVKEHLGQWIFDHRSIFYSPSSDETEFIAEIFKVPHFQGLVIPSKRLTYNPIADPFVIASAKVRNWTVVTEETIKENSARIPNVCKHFGIGCINLETMMGQENMKY